MMKHLFSINAEGGPLLLCDAPAAKNWAGSEEGGADYERLCAMLDARPEEQGAVFAIGGAQAVVWEMSGAGVADVFLSERGEVVLVRAWLDDDNATTLQSLAEAPASNPVRIGRLNAASQRIAILWAAESGKGVSDSSSEQVKCVESGTAIDGSVYVLRTAASAFDCVHDEVVFNGSQARRLKLIPN